MKLCLSTSDIESLITYKIDNGCVDDDSNSIFSLSENWEKSLGVLSYFIARIIEKKEFQTIKECKDFVNAIYMLPEEMWVIINDCDFEFTQALMGNIRYQNLSLEDDLVANLEKVLTHNYV